MNPSRVFVDRLFRTDAVAPPASPAGANDARAEATRLWTSTFNAGGDLVPADRSYLARLIASQTGISQADAEKRVNDVIVEAKAAADRPQRRCQACLLVDRLALVRRIRLDPCRGRRRTTARRNVAGPSFRSASLALKETKPCRSCCGS